MVRKRVFVFAFILLVSCILFYQCTKRYISRGLTVEQVVFNRLGENGEPVIARGTPLYNKGEVVVMGLKNVSGFVKGPDGLNMMSMDVVITGPDGKVIMKQEGLKTENEHVDLPGNVASEPWVRYMIDRNAKPGKYRFTVTVHDLVSGRYLTINRKFRVRVGY